MYKRSKVSKWLLIIGLAMVGIYLALAAAVYVFQRDLLYHPSRAPGGALLAAAKSGLTEWIADGKCIGWHTTHPHPKASVLFFHGNAGNAVFLNSFLPGLQSATQGGVQAYFLEYPGYGHRPGKPSEAALIQAAHEALAALPAALPVYLVGQSLGCAVAAGLWAEAPSNRVSGAILVVPFNNLQDTAQHHFPILPMEWLLQDRYRSDARLARDLGPLYVALAERDRVIPVGLGKQLYDGYPGRKKLMIKPGAGHNDLNHPDAAWWRAALGFIAPNLIP